MLAELRFALRQLAKSPGFSVVALLTLALGIGANTSMYSVLNAVMFRTPYPDDDRLVRIFRTSPQSRTWPHSIANYLDHRAAAKSFERLAAVSWTSFNLAEPGQPADRLRGLSVSADFFPLLGFNAELGRTFTPEDDQPGHNHVLVISHATWLQRFGGDRAVLGRELRLNGEPAMIIGVMPASFDVVHLWGYIEAWRPIAFSDQQRQNRGNNYLSEVGRLKPGVTRAQAQAEMDAIAARLAAAYPQNNAQIGLRLVPLALSGQDEVGQRVGWFVLALAGFVLLIACANLANLQFARHAARVRELGIRTALGASRLRLMRGILVESLLLSLAGGALGVLVAVWCNNAIGAHVLMDGHLGLVVPLDCRVLAFATTISVATGLGFGLLPAGLASRTDVNEALKQNSRGTTAGRAPHRLRHALIVGEVALALTLLAGAGFFVRGLRGFVQRDPGWRVEGLVTGKIFLQGKKYSDAAARRTFVERLQETLAALPGVESAVVGDALPTWGFSSSGNFLIEGRPPPAAGLEPLACQALVSPGYFSTLGLHLRQGRDFTADDTAGNPPVVIINESMARAFWPGENALGKRLGGLDPQHPNWREIVGVVSDSRAPGSLTPPDSRFQMFQPIRQQTVAYLMIALRTNAAPETLAPAVRRAVAAIDGDQPVYNITTVRHEIDNTLANAGLSGAMLSGFALLGVVLAAVGIYGVMAGAVVQRTNEFGIRLALGAQVRDILALVLGQGLRLALLGTALGLAGAWAVARLLRAIAPELSAADTLTTVAITAFLVAITAFACWLPARRATKVDPMVALRCE